MVSSRKVLAYLLTYTLIPLGLPTVNAAEETLLGEKAAAKADETSLTVRIDSPNSKWDPAKQYTLPRSGLTLLPSAETNYARPGYNLTANATGAVGSVNSGPNLLKLIKPESRRLREFNGLEFGLATAGPRSMYPQDTTQAPQQQPSPQPRSKKLGKALTILGIGMIASGGAMMAHGNEGCVGECIDWRATGGVWAGAGAVLLVIGLVKLR
jgi:hypothetical protein